jgi:hypothetical protein
MEETETTSLWNKKTSDLTVRDLAIVNFAAPIIMIGGVVAVGVVLAAKDKIVSKFRKTAPVVQIVADNEES